MPYVVKITVDDDGCETGRKEWCYVWETSGSHCTLCTLEVFGEGESGAEYEVKYGKITCPDCIAIIKEFKSIRL